MTEDIIKVLSATKALTALDCATDAIESDKFSIDELKIPSMLLMECAGTAVARNISARIKGHQLNNKRAFFFVGPGNNGADGLVAARHLLSKGVGAVIFFTAPKEKWGQEFKRQIDILKSIHKKLHDKSLLLFHDFDHDHLASLLKDSPPQIIVDGIFGAGLNKAPGGLSLDAITFINSQRKNLTVLSIDIPSGLSLNAEKPLGDHVIADVTVTFGELKLAHVSEPTKSCCGEVVLEKIGLFKKGRQKYFYVPHQKVLKQLFKPLATETHKGHFGHVAILAGSPRYQGASMLAARSALRSGAGLVSIIGDHAENKNKVLPDEVMLLDFASLDKDLINSFDALVLGPGLGTEASFKQRAHDLFTSYTREDGLLVVDADALHLIKAAKLKKSGPHIVLTPHPKEAAKLLGMSTEKVLANRFSAIEQLAKLGDNSARVTWILKGASTLLRTADGTTFVFKGDLPVLSVGGSGDILSGAIAGLYRQTTCPPKAALLAISLAIAAGLKYSRLASRGIFASEFTDLFPKLTKRT